MVGKVGTGKLNSSLACTSAVGNKTKFVVWKKGREMRKRVAWSYNMLGQNDQFKTLIGESRADIVYL